MENVVDRLIRWARELPVTESLPVTGDERYELVEVLLPVTQFPNQKFSSEDHKRREFLRSLDAGQVKFLRHPVEVLR